jgi:hypothetical protein
MNRINVDINMGTEYLTVKSSTVVKLFEDFEVITENGPINLRVDISADFEKIPEEYYEIFFNVLTSKYSNRVSFGQNPFSECKPVVKRKWYQFWKSKYINE